MIRVRTLAFVVLGLLAGQALYAQGLSSERPLGATAQQLPAYLAHAGIEQRLGQPLPLAATFTDETGRTGSLKSWFDGKPVVMAEIYYKCALLCPQIVHGLAVGLAQTTLMPGKDYQMMVFSIDPTDTPADAVNEKKTFLGEAGWSTNAEAAKAVHFFTGTPPNIAAMAGATGFHFVQVPGPDGKMDQFAHSSVIMFATPDGKMSKYMSGINYAPRDLRMALLDASQKKISNPVDLIILYCCSYSPVSGRYSVSIVRILSLAGVVTVLAVIGTIFLLGRKPKSLSA